MGMNVLEGVGETWKRVKGKVGETVRMGGGLGYL